VYHTYSDYARGAGVSLGHVPVARATRLIATVTTPSHASLSILRDIQDGHSIDGRLE